MTKYDILLAKSEINIEANSLHVAGDVRIDWLRWVKGTQQLVVACCEHSLDQISLETDKNGCKTVLLVGTEVFCKDIIPYKVYYKAHGSSETEVIWKRDEKP